MQEEAKAERLWDGGPLFIQAESAKLTTDTVLLADFAANRRGERGLDLGCASGALLLLLLWREESLKMTGVELLDRDLQLRNAAVDMGDPGAEPGHVVAMLHVLAGQVVELVQVLGILLNDHAALGVVHVQDGLEHHAGAFLDELTHGVEVGGVVHAGGEDAGAVLAF